MKNRDPNQTAKSSELKQPSVFVLYFIYI